MVSSAQAKNLDAFKRGLSPQFVDVVERIQPLMKDEPLDLQKSFSWTGVMRDVARSPMISSFKMSEAGTALFAINGPGMRREWTMVKTRDGWKFVDPKLVLLEEALSKGLK